MRKRTNPFRYRFAAVLVVLAFAISGISGVEAKDDPPQTTTDGLELVKQTRHRLVYLHPEADISQYTSVSILDCYVAFRKNWERDYNRNFRDLQHRVDDHDMDRIKKRLADEFKKIFIEELSKDGKHEVVDHVGPEVLVLRPAIVNLDVTAPDTGTVAARSRTYTASAGSMTLYLELYDSVSSAILAKIMDAEADRQGASNFSMSNRVTNTAAADRILRSWARELEEHLGEVKPAARAEDE